MRAQESTVASGLNDVFPIANPTGEVKVQIDPCQLQVIEGPQHDLLTTSLMSEIIVMFDSDDLANIPRDDGRMDYENRVKLNFERLQTNLMVLRDSNIELPRVINNPITDLIVNQLGRDECLYRLGRLDDADHWKILGGALGLGTIRVKVTLTINKTMKATQVSKNTMGDLYFAMLDHPGSRGPGVMITPAEASEGRVQFGAIELIRASIEEQPEAFQNVVITEVMIKKSLDWIHDCLYYLTSDYEWDLGKIDKEGFMPIKFVVYMLRSCWEKTVF